MAKITTVRKNDGSLSYGTQVRVKPFKGVFQSFPTKKEALAWAATLTAQLREERKKGNTRPEVGSATLGVVNAAYLADPETRGLGDFVGVERMVNWWTERYVKVRALEFGVRQIREGRDRLLESNEAGTANRYLAWQRAAWNWARNAGFGLTAAWPTGVMLTEPDARVRYLSDKELTDVLNAARADSPVMYAAVTLAIAAGPRISEMLRLKWRDIDLQYGVVRFLKTKNDNARSVHLPQAAIDALLAIKRTDATATSLVFVDADGEWMYRRRVNTRWDHIRVTAKLVDFHWHDFRHTCASLLGQNGANLLEIGTVLGHKSPQTTIKYTHLVKGKAVTGHAELNERLAAHAALPMAVAA